MPISPAIFSRGQRRSRTPVISPASMPADSRSKTAPARPSPPSRTSANRSPRNISVPSRSGSIRTRARHRTAALCIRRPSPPVERRMSRRGSTRSLRAAKRSLQHVARPTPPTATATLPICLKSCSISASQARPIPHTDAESAWRNYGQSSDTRADHADFRGPSTTSPFAAALREA